MHARKGWENRKTIWHMCSERAGVTAVGDSFFKASFVEMALFWTLDIDIGDGSLGSR